MGKLINNQWPSSESIVAFVGKCRRNTLRRCVDADCSDPSLVAE